MAKKNACGSGDHTFDLEQFRRIYPYRSRWYRNNNLCQHYVDEGEGEPMVMVHGNPSWSFHFRRLIERFKGEYRVIVPDHIGMGMSEKPGDDAYGHSLKDRIDDLERLMQKLGVEKDVTLVVHDWGGMIGCGWAIRKPSRIKRIVILNSYAFRIPRTKKLPATLWMIKNIPGINSVAIQGLNIFLRGAVKVGVEHPMPDNIKKAYLAPYDSWDHRLSVLRFIQDIPAGPGDESYSLTKKIDRNLNRLKDKPILICWGLKDFIFDKKILREWKRRFPEAKLRKFKDGGHFVLEDKPRDVITAMEEFLKENP